MTYHHIIYWLCFDLMNDLTTDYILMSNHKMTYVMTLNDLIAFLLMNFD